MGRFTAYILVREVQLSDTAKVVLWGRHGNLMCWGGHGVRSPVDGLWPGLYDLHRPKGTKGWCRGLHSGGSWSI